MRVRVGQWEVDVGAEEERVQDDTDREAQLWTPVEGSGYRRL